MRRYLPFALALLVICAATFAITWQVLSSSSDAPIAIPIAAVVLALLGALLIASTRWRTRVRAEARGEVALPAAKVFALVADLRTMPQYTPAVSQVELNGPLGVGSVFRVHLRQGSGRLVRELEVTAYEPPHSIVANLRFRGRSRQSQTGLAVNEVDESRSTVLSWTEVETPTVLAGWIRRRLEKAETEGMAAIRAWLETSEGRAEVGSPPA